MKNPYLKQKIFIRHNGRIGVLIYHANLCAVDLLEEYPYPPIRRLTDNTNGIPHGNATIQNLILHTAPRIEPKHPNSRSIGQRCPE